MQRVIFVKKDDIYELNKRLADGWRVQQIYPITAHPCGTSYDSGFYGAYIVIEMCS